MCRKRRTWGSCLISFGAGLIFGQWISSAVLCVLLALGLMGMGLCICGRR